jgi:transcription elongation GreA/GreB family factor
MKTADELHDLLDRARVIDPTQISTDRASFGTQVVVQNQSNQKQEEYAILGIWEANPEKNIISYLSPLGTSFLGKALGETVIIDLPQGKVQYKIIKIHNALL